LGHFPITRLAVGIGLQVCKLVAKLSEVERMLPTLSP
jgi:hypothetical protein